LEEKLENAEVAKKKLSLKLEALKDQNLQFEA
jgi:hypothetical protein